MLSVMTSVNVPTGSRQRRSARRITPMSMPAWSRMAAAPRDFSPSPTNVSVTSPVCTNGWAKDVKNVSSDRIAVNEMIAGKRVAQLFVDMGCPRVQEQPTQEPADEDGDYTIKTDASNIMLFLDFA